MARIRLPVLVALVVALGMRVCVAEEEEVAQPGPDPSDAPVETGIEGIVVMGPMCPGPVRIGTPCPDQPYQARITVLDEQGQEVARFQSQPDGHFIAALAPGIYILRPEPPWPGALPRGKEQTVGIIDGQLTQVRITYDTGMR